MKQTALYYALDDSPLGLILVAACQQPGSEPAQSLCAVIPGDHQAALLDCLGQWFPDHQLTPGNEITKALLDSVIRLANAEPLADAPLLTLQGTDFQKQVWRALLAIPAGETRSYGQLARQLGKPQGARAVASACAANRLAIVVPCHRVVAADGKLSGYRWGPHRKQRLLQQEALRVVADGGMTSGSPVLK